MLFTAAAAASAVLASTAFASPLESRQATGDNGSCAALRKLCGSQTDANLSNPWSVEACVLGSTCFGGHRPVDDFLAAVYSDKGGQGTAPTSRNVPRVSDGVFNSISSDKKVVTQQNFIDAYYHTLDQSGGPYPTSSSAVVSYFNRVQQWTSYCGQSVPKMNFLDYFQYSATVQGSGCPQSSSVAPTTVYSSSLAGPTTYSSSAAQVSSYSVSSVSAQSSASTASATYTSSAAAPTGSLEASCRALLNLCLNQVDAKVTNPWNPTPCVFAASCNGGQGSIDSFLSNVYYTKGNSGPAPKSRNVPRVPSGVLKSIGTNGTHISQQNFIDGYYRTLDQSNGPYPSSVNIVTGYFSRLQGWAGYCREAIPYMNFADYYQYSATVYSPGQC